jgi:triacylglycerol lipase
MASNHLIVPQLRSPIVLVHGLFGFDRVQVAGWTFCYFPGIPELLESGKNRVLVPQLSPTCGVAERAKQLRGYLDRQTPGEPVHLIAHSMGGLDSRYMISQLGSAHRVLSLTSIATPHRGSPIADWGINRLGRVVKPFLEMFGIPHQAFYDLTTKKCKEFNSTVKDAPGVRYFSVAGKHEVDWSTPEWLLLSQIMKVEGQNDGLVSVASATHGESTEVWDGDHLSLANMTSPTNRALGKYPDRNPFYAALIRRLADLGF